MGLAFIYTLLLLATANLGTTDRGTEAQRHREDKRTESSSSKKCILSLVSSVPLWLALLSSRHPVVLAPPSG
jgi:hypothetical protein